MGKLRLFAALNVVARADEVMEKIIEIYDMPHVDFRNPVGQARAAGASTSCGPLARGAERTCSITRDMAWRHDASTLFQ